MAVGNSVAGSVSVVSDVPKGLSAAPQSQPKAQRKAQPQTRQMAPSLAYIAQHKQYQSCLQYETVVKRALEVRLFQVHKLSLCGLTVLPLVLHYLFRTRTRVCAPDSGFWSNLFFHYTVTFILFCGLYKVLFSAKWRYFHLDFATEPSLALQVVRRLFSARFARLSGVYCLWTLYMFYLIQPVSDRLAFVQFDAQYAFGHVSELPFAFYFHGFVFALCYVSTHYVYFDRSRLRFREDSFRQPSVAQRMRHAVVRSGLCIVVTTVSARVLYALCRSRYWAGAQAVSRVFRGDSRSVVASVADRFVADGISVAIECLLLVLWELFDELLSAHVFEPGAFILRTTKSAPQTVTSLSSLSDEPDRTLLAGLCRPGPLNYSRAAALQELCFLANSSSPDMAKRRRGLLAAVEDPGDARTWRWSAVHDVCCGYLDALVARVAESCSTEAVALKRLNTCLGVAEEDASVADLRGEAAGSVFAAVDDALTALLLKPLDSPSWFRPVASRRASWRQAAHTVAESGREVAQIVAKQPVAQWKSAFTTVAQRVGLSAAEPVLRTLRLNHTAARAVETRIVPEDPVASVVFPLQALTGFLKHSVADDRYGMVHESLPGVLMRYYAGLVVLLTYSVAPGADRLDFDTFRAFHSGVDADEMAHSVIASPTVALLIKYHVIGLYTLARTFREYLTTIQKELPLELLLLLNTVLSAFQCCEKEDMIAGADANFLSGRVVAFPEMYRSHDFDVAQQGIDLSQNAGSLFHLYRLKAQPKYSGLFTNKLQLFPRLTEPDVLGGSGGAAGSEEVSLTERVEMLFFEHLCVLRRQHLSNFYRGVYEPTVARRKELVAQAVARAEMRQK